MEKQDACKPILNVAEAVKTSKSSFIRNLPKFAVNRIAKIIREKELNEIHLKYCHLWGMDYVKALLFDEYNVTINYFQEGEIEKNGRYVYASNHPLGAVDALSLLYVIDQIHGRVISPANDLFEYIPNLMPVLMGINVFRMNTKEKAEELNKLFAGDIPIMIFPAGEVSRKFDGKIEDPPWKKTFVTKAINSKRDIIPVYISGTNSKKFYRVASWRKRLGIKMYVETMLLPQEMLRKYNATIDIYLGKPVTFEEMKNSGLNHHELTTKIRKISYSLPDKFKNQKNQIQ